MDVDYSQGDVIAANKRVPPPAFAGIKPAKIGDHACEKRRSSCTYPHHWPKNPLSFRGMLLPLPEVNRVAGHAST
jgi:hypothetical protein